MKLLGVDSFQERPHRATLMVVGLLLVLAVLASACAPPQAPQAPSTATAGTGQPSEAAGETSLKMALLPVMDVLPFYVAEKNGYFADEGIQVEAVPVKTAQERDTLMQTGQVDGELTDLIGPVLLNQRQPTAKVVYTARRAYPDSPMFSILAAPGSTISAPADLKGVPIGISQNTVIEYLTDRMLQAQGLAAEDIAITEVSAIPVRFELLMKGELQAANLPDPLASGAVAAGARTIIDDSQYPELAQSVLVFRTEALESRPETVKKFLQAWDRAASEINTNPDAYRDLLIQVGRVPESIQGSYAMPPFPTGSITSESEMADVVEWARDKGKIEVDIPYQNLVDPGFMPGN